MKATSTKLDTKVKEKNNTHDTHTAYSGCSDPWSRPGMTALKWPGMKATSTKLNTKVKEKNNTHDTYTVLIVDVQIPGPGQG